MPEQTTENSFARLRLLIGDSSLDRLFRSRILLCGVGGVGSWAAESLIRSGIGHLTMVDFDCIKSSNINRQLPASSSTIGRLKGEVMELRLQDISPEADIRCLPVRLNEENIPEILDSGHWDYVIDAIDERLPKLCLIQNTLDRGIPMISSMGSANKMLPDRIQVADISETSGCPMAKLLRKNLKKLGIRTGLKVVFSPELPILLNNGAFCSEEKEGAGEKRPLGTISYMPAMFGLRCAAAVIQDLLKDQPPVFRRGDGVPPAAGG